MLTSVATARIWAVLAIAAVIFSQSCPSVLIAQTVPPAMQKEFDAVSELVLDGQYTDAIQRLENIIQDYPNSDDVLRTAYNHLVATYQEMGESQRVLEKAREGLLRFPDLAADTRRFPTHINDIYDQLRRDLFGRLAIPREEGATVYLDDNTMGVAPIPQLLVRVGQHALRLEKPGYYDYEELILIEPEAILSRDIPLKPRKTWKWWSSRVGASAVVLGLVAWGVAASQGDSGTPPADPPVPLDGPPPPPSR